MIDERSRDQTIGPVVLAMGVSRDLKGHLAGSTVIESQILADAISRPEAYYLALYVENEHATAELEAGRSPLIRNPRAE